MHALHAPMFDCMQRPTVSSTDVTAEVALALRRRVDHFLDDEESDDGGRVAVQLELERPALGLAVRAGGLQVREAEQRPDVVPEGGPAGERRRVPGLAEGLEPEQHLAALPPPRAPQADHHRRRLVTSHVAGRTPAERSGAGGAGRRAPERLRFMAYGARPRGRVAVVVPSAPRSHAVSAQDLESSGARAVW